MSWIYQLEYGHTPHGENYAFLDLSKKIGIHICAEFAAESAAESAAEIQLLSCRHNAATIAADTTCGGKAYHMIIKVDD